ncbi:glycosyltransferase family 4 protein [Mycobacterium sp. ITM-2016-00317]|uniref:glycosyltransferase family 4 protein n=1 Tax=Mycobacterium sp. ITM-2016-00317 TaxID=2099694 RepID=UPI000D4F1581|nr:glycosyltransferase family 4 protein [Mycobacterium sp. ITM-2016-00317]WNG88845.1 glycosyltransferase family 4 protein [Mycobacterium sp. ITM-2016-00317]
MSHGRAGGRRPVALIVGPGDRFLSGVSYYTALLTDALAERGPVAALLLRRLCPRVLYPGRARVGSTDGMLPLPKVSVFNGLDWFWGPSAVGAWRFWRRTQPTVVILQWWTATVLHSYLVIAWLAKRAGARLVIEFHETQDIGEAGLPLVGRYTRAGMNLLLERADAIVVHSDFDRRELTAAYPRLAQLPVEVILHGPYPQHAEQREIDSRAESVAPQPVRVLIFGVVRPYKGHADLADAVRLLVESGVDIHLSVVGEVWQGYRQPLDELRSLLPADRLTVVDRYVADHEVPGFFATADLVVLPYRRSSASGPLHIAMSCGLPVVTTSVGGLVEATEGYSGAVLVPPGDPDALADGIRIALPLVGRAHADPHSWRRTAERYEALLNRVHADWGHSAPVLRSSLPA